MLRSAPNSDHLRVSTWFQGVDIDIWSYAATPYADTTSTWDCRFGLPSFHGPARGGVVDWRGQTLGRQNGLAVPSTGRVLG